MDARPEAMSAIDRRVHLSRKKFHESTPWTILDADWDSDEDLLSKTQADIDARKEDMWSRMPEIQRMREINLYKQACLFVSLQLDQ
jgi:hypothetical protein